jgi:hypothetical protein
MQMYERPPPTHRSRGPNYAGLIAVTCLLVSMFATWAMMRTNLGAMISPAVTMAQSNRAQ